MGVNCSCAEEPQTQGAKANDDSFRLVSTLLRCCYSWCHRATCPWERAISVRPWFLSRHHPSAFIPYWCFTHRINAKTDANIPPKLAPSQKKNPVNLFSALEPSARVKRMSQSRTMLSNETTRPHFGTGKLCEVMASYGNRGNSWKLVLHLHCYGRPFTSSISCRLFIFCRRWRVRSRPGMTRSCQGCVSCIMLKWFSEGMPVHIPYPQ